MTAMAIKDGGRGARPLVVILSTFFEKRGGLLRAVRAAVGGLPRPEGSPKGETCKQQSLFEKNSATVITDL